MCVCVCIYVCVCQRVSAQHSQDPPGRWGRDVYIYMYICIYIYIYVCVRDVHLHHLGRSDTHLNALPTIQYIKAT